MHIVVAMVLIGLLSGAAPSTRERPSDRRLPAGFAQRLLELHNAERARVGSPPLAWDGGLAAAAATYARRLAARDRGLVHSAPRTRRGQGENLWMGTAGHYPAAAMFGSWAQERRHFRPGVFPDVGQGVAWQRVGHYTQIVWSGTDRVGCATHSDGRWDYLVCRYAPAGNVIGQTVF
jgi:hypothetical protein